MKAFARFPKNRSLRIVNLLSLSVIFACLLLSGDYLKKEWSYDRHHLHADRMARLSLRFGDEPVDGRIYLPIDPILEQMPEIEQVVKLEKLYTAVLNNRGEKRIINNFYLASPHFLELFTLPLVSGNAEEALNSDDKVLLSERFAQQLFGSEDALGKEIQIHGRKINAPSLFVSGVYKDFPETSHFHTDVIVKRPDDYSGFVYYYLLLQEGADVGALEEKLTASIQGAYPDFAQNASALLMPLTDIHLHSRVLREMEGNGNIDYLYLIVAANLLLLVIALFNVWLNVRLIFSYSRRYYQLLRLNGASAFTVIKDEAQYALLLSILSMLVGGLAVYLFTGHLAALLAPSEVMAGCLLFLLLVMAVSLLPVIANISSSLFLNTNEDIKLARFSYANVTYMLTAQYAIVAFILIVAFGISRQMAMVRQVQAGGNDPHILVMSEQPGEVNQRYDLLKSELIKYPSIYSVTACFQLPGDAIRDAVEVKRAGSDDSIRIPTMVVGEDFIPFFHIKVLAGTIFHPFKISFQEETDRLYAFFEGHTFPDMSEEYMLNKKALSLLGFDTPQEAIGKTLQLDHEAGLGYIGHGVICGVTDDFNYTGVREVSHPLLIVQRRLYLFCIMVRFDPKRPQEALADFHRAWQEVIPDYPADYSFMNDLYRKLYYNELNAERLVYLFSLLCLLIADLGLIVFMAFIIKRRTKEIAIRKVNGASIGDIIRMLNLNFTRWILLAFIIVAPAAGYVLHKWLQNFAYKATISWWIYAVAGVSVLALSFLSVSVQSWRAATVNPVEGLKGE